jgi:hypothetical protein
VSSLPLSPSPCVVSLPFLSSDVFYIASRRFYTVITFSAIRRERLIDIVYSGSMDYSVELLKKTREKGVGIPYFNVLFLSAVVFCAEK